MRKEVIGHCELYLGDCLEVLPLIERAEGPLLGEPTVHVITDPPYEAEAHTHGRRLLGKQTNGKRTVEYGALDFGCITEETRRKVSALCVERCSGWFLAFCQAEAVASWRDAHLDAGAVYKRAMVWIKPDGAPQFTGDRPGMGYESIVASWCGGGRSSWNGGGRHGVFRHPHRDDNNKKLHPTQKPIALMKELVTLFSRKDDLVIDPFMGSGTTGVACAKTDRRFIGIELDEKHFETACKRIDDAYRQADMFLTSSMLPRKEIP